MVEDEVRLAETIRRGLVAEGFVTAVELNGDDGFATACSDEFDVIVLDIMLPGKHGYDIVRGSTRPGDLDADPHALGKGRRIRPG